MTTGVVPTVEIEIYFDVAAEVGLDEAAARAFLDSPAGVAEVRAELAAAYDLGGVTSVPTFVFAGGYAVTGAQEPETLRAVLDEVARRKADHRG